MIRGIYNRIYSDYIMPSRLNEYEKIIQSSLEKGYKHLSLIQFFDLLKNNQIKLDHKYFIHRHDIDSDLKTTRKIFEIEKKNKIYTSFYFRLSTLDIDLMKQINEYGSEASYHYEELAQYCKDNHIKSKTDIDKSLKQIREIFSSNFHNIQNSLGYKLKTVASHGDFVNRKLSISNFYFLNEELRHSLGIEAEAYDDIFIKNYSEIISDSMYPKFYKPRNIFDVINDNKQVIYLLSHPRHWETNFYVNTIDNITRTWQGFKYEYF